MPTIRLFEPPGLRAEQAQRRAAAVIGRLVGLGFGEAFDLHQNFSPFSMR